MRLKIDEYRDAIHPSEVVVVVRTSQGEETLVVDRKSLDGNLLEVGAPLEGDQTRVLVELPRETYSGAWRVWVSKESLVSKAA